MNRRKLLTMAGGLIPVGVLPNISKEGDVPGPGDADIQALYARVDGLQRQLDYKKLGDSPFQRSDDFAYGRVLDRQTGMVDVANTAAETTLYSFLMAPNTLYNNRSVRLEMYGDYLNNTGGNETFDLRLKLGSTTMTTLSGTFSTSASRRYWRWSILLSADSSLNAQQAYFLVASMNTVAGLSGDPFGTATVDALQPLAIGVTMDWNTASANLSMRRQFASLELI